MQWKVVGLVSGFACGFAAVLGILCGGSSAQAFTYSWTDSGTADWNTGSNWSGSFVPGPADVAEFINSASYANSPSIGSASQVGGLWDTGSAALAIGGAGALTIYGTTISGSANAGIYMDSAAGPWTIATPITLGGSQQWINNSSNPLTVSGTVANGGNVLTLAGSGATTLAGPLKGNGGLTVAGPGLATFSAGNFYTGATTVNGGTLQLAAGPVSGFNTSNWTQQYVSGGSFVIINNSTNTAMLTNGNGGIQNNLWNNTPVAGLATQPWTVSFTYSDTNGAFGDGGSFILQTLGVSTTGGNWQANGGISPSINLVWNIVDTGHTRFGFNTNGGNGATYNTLGNVNMASTTPINVTIAYNGSSAVTVSMVQGANSCNLNYAANLASTLGTTSPVYFGFGAGQGGSNSAQQISNFSMATNDLPTTSALTIASGALVDLNGDAQSIGSLSGAGTLTNSNTNSAAPLTVGGDNTPQTFSGLLASAAPGLMSLTKIGSGAQTLSGTSSYAGGTTINGGALVFSSTSAVPSIGAITINAGGAAGVSGPVAAASVLTLTNTASTGALAIASANSETLDFTNYPALSLGSVGSNTYSGSLTPAGATYRLGGGGGALTYAPAITGGNGLTLGAGPGTVVLTASNNYTGPTTVNTGSLMLGHPLAAQNSTVSVNVNNGLSFAAGVTTPSIGALAGAGNLSLLDASGGSVQLAAGGNNASTAYYGVLSGSGGLTKTGSGVMTLGNQSNYTGPTTVSEGTLQLASPNISGISSAGWTIQNTAGGAATISGSMALVTVNGGELNNVWDNTPMAGLTTQPWTASFTYTNTAQGAYLNATDGWQFILQTAGTTARTDGVSTWKTVSGYGPMAAVAWVLTSTSVGSTGITHVGFGASANGSNFGTTAISNTNLIMASSTPTDITVAYNGSSAITVSMTEGSNTWSGSYSANLATTLGGSGTLAYFGFGGGEGGSQAIQGVSNFSITSLASNINILPSASPVQIASGAVADLNGNAQTIGSLSGAGTLTNGNAALPAALTVGGDNTSQTFSGVLTSATPGYLSLTKTGSGVQTFSAVNAFGGATTINGGAIALGNANALQNSTVTVNAGNGLAFAAGVAAPAIGALSGSGNVSLEDASSNPVQLSAGGNGATTSYTGALGGSGGLTKTGGGLMTLGNQNSYAGATIVAGGTLQLAGGFVSGFNGAGWTIQNVRGNAATISGGTATLTSGGSTYNNVWCNNPLAGLTTQPWTASFTYTDSANGGLGALTDGGQFILQTAGASARTTGTDMWTTVTGYGPEAAFDWTMPNLSTMNVGFGPGWPIGTNSLLGSGIDLWDAPVAVTLAYNGSSTVTVTLSQTGTVWTHTYAANLASTLGGVGTEVYFGFGGSQGGATAIQEVSNFSLTSLGSNGLPTRVALQVASGAVVDLNGLSQVVGSLSDYSGAGGLVTNSGASAATLTVGNDGTNTTFSGVIGDGASQVGLTKTGSGMLTLAGSNTYSGGTAISGGTLQIGNGASGEALASPTVAMSNNATLAFNHSDALTYSGSIGGDGQLVKQGSGLLVLSGSNTYSGATTVGGGTLQIGNGTSGEGLASPSIIMSNNAAVAFNHADPLSYSGAISGSGQLIKLGTGNLDLVGSGTYSGPTTISAGTLELDGNGDNLPAATALTIAASGVLDLAGNPLTVGSLSGSAGAVVTNRYASYPATLTVASSSGATTFAGNIIGNNALALSGSGQLTLSGTNTYYGGTTVSGGTLDIAAPSALAGSGLVTIAAGGRLVLGSGAGIGALLAASSPAGSGAVVLSAAAAPATFGGCESGSENMATLSGAPALSQGGGGIAVGSAAAAVPEPGTIALLAVGILMLAVARRRRRG